MSTMITVPFNTRHKEDLNVANESWYFGCDIKKPFACELDTYLSRIIYYAGEAGAPIDKLHFREEYGH